MDQFFSGISTSDGSLELENAGCAADRFAVSELAITQMCQRLNIPVPYYRRLPMDMRAALANHDFGRLKDNVFLLRGKNEWLRAFLSSD